jgi:hypothetical protein
VRFSLQIFFVSAAMTVSSVASAQTGGAGAKPAGQLKIVVVEGEGAKNNIRTRFASNLVVEVRDEADKPVSGAEVVFQLPAMGPGGFFHGWLKTQTVRTGENGRAVAVGFTPNDEEGRFNIKVTATAGERMGSAIISQANYRGSRNEIGSGGQKTWWKYALAAGAVGGLIGGIVAARETTSTPSAAAATPAPVTISPGAITIGSPR